MAYAEEADLLTGGIPWPLYITKSQALQNASDEVDSYLAQRYVTPVALPAVPGGSQVDPYRQVRLILKRLTGQLASARVILAAAAGGEDSEVHAYGEMLLREALAALRAIASGDVLLPDIPANPGLPGTTESSLPLVLNADPYSQVDAFYGVTTPGNTMMTPQRGY